MTQKLTPILFSTDIQIAVRPVSNVLMMEVQKSIPRPKPPVERVANADGTFREEPNPDHPDYAAALSKWTEQVEEAVRKLCIKRGVVLHMTDEQKAEVAELREFMRTEFDQALDADDRYVYVAYIAVGGQEDYAKLVNTIVGRSQPTDPKSASG
ncbi:MAG: hypothetical protein IT323_13560 [Anaerolineae bacterium]|nr:hypothetical protein [Anaerolineae bacterium]